MAREPAAKDAQLVEGARLGDASAFDALVRRYARAAHAIALSTTRDHQDAEDVCQDAFVRSLERLDECRRPEQFGGWLLAIVRNTAQNHQRRRRVRRTETFDAIDAPSRDSPARDAEQSELRARMVDALGTLSSVECEVVLLHDLESWTHSEIGHTLGISEVNSRQQLFVARRKLRDCLRDLAPYRTEHD